ncbi:nuclear transport factor 2 family protein [Oceanicola granulosus]|nr:nuclear transport factor 2 family protein [Oceanicola granulosus]
MKTQDKLDVMRVLNDYIKATRDGDGDILRRIFHPDAMVAGWFGSDLLMRNPEGFIARAESTDAGPDYQACVACVNVLGDTATAMVTEDGLWEGWSFLNHFHLVRDKTGQWIITAKLFQRD